jgi:choline monooxygenase
MIHPDIRGAQTLPASFYRDPEIFRSLKEAVFRNAWHYTCGRDQLNDTTNAIPLTLLPGFLDEPVIMAKTRDGQIRCLSNVCTHRGNLLVTERRQLSRIRCNYHGRCFDMDGVCRSHPGFDAFEDFPGPSDDLTLLDTKSLGALLLCRAARLEAFDSVFEPLQERMSWYDFDSLSCCKNLSRDYTVNAHWALYVDNYLEGYHVPFVHPGLNRALDLKGYTYELFPGASLQLGRASIHETEVFDIPAGAADAGERIYAYYWWIFPNLMINVYPWGVSLNSVEPLTPEKTCVRFIAFVRGDTDIPDLAPIHQTELEDEAIVEQVQRGIGSSFYTKGRYAPEHEIAVHHFHRLLSTYLDHQ